jgi:hypothetical protein
MKVRLVILASFVLGSFLLYSAIGTLTSLVGNSIEGQFTKFAFKIAFMIKAIGVGLSLLACIAIIGLVYSKKKIKNEDYYRGFTYASVYIGVIFSVYLYLLVFKT